jgi:aryl-alcohol dehydrogenase-like predicted oxidoreductase
MAATAVRFVLHQPAVASAVVGIRTINQLQEIAQIKSAPALTSEDIQLLRKSLEANTYTEHR